MKTNKRRSRRCIATGEGQLGGDLGFDGRWTVGTGTEGLNCLIPCRYHIFTSPFAITLHRQIGMDGLRRCALVRIDNHAPSIKRTNP
jgi:hypothetical protein